jgi:hypothetical protein
VNVSEIHISDVMTFKGCRRKWNYASMLRMGLEPARPYAPFWTGRAMHYGLEMHYKCKMPAKIALFRFLRQEVKQMQSLGPLWPQERLLVRENIRLVADILRHYKAWARSMRGDLADSMFEVVATEKKFHLPLRDRYGRASDHITLAGKIDLVLRHKRTGKLWLGEHKTCRSLDERQGMLAFEEQPSVYLIAAAEEYGETPAGVLYNLIRKKAPELPSTLKKRIIDIDDDAGLKLSCSVKDQTVESFLRAVRQHHGSYATGEFIGEHYGDVLAKLKEKPNEFFRRVPVFRTPAHLDLVRQELWEVAHDMVAAPAIYPNGSMSCSWCSFKEPCAAKNEGRDEQFVLRENFRRRQVEEVEEV